MNKKHLHMNIKSNLLVSLRHLKADKTNTVINITGLVLGLGIVTVVLVFVLNELGYNSSFKNKDRIYRVLNNNDITNQTWANTPFVLGETIKDGMAEVENCTHQINIGEYEVEKNNDYIKESSMLCTDASFFNIFGIQILQGDLDNFDKTNGNILLSKSMADKYFKGENAIGKVIKVKTSGTGYPMVVSAIYADFPKNSSLRASSITNSDFGLKYITKIAISNSPLKLNEVDFKESWSYGQFTTNYILLKDGASPGALEAKLKKTGIEHSDDMNRMSFSLQPLSDIYFGSGKFTDNNSGDLGNKPMLYVLASTGLLILIIACINYLNLTSAQTLTRAKTLAVRKVCGAGRTALMTQMMAESIFISLISFPFALLFAKLSLPFVSEMLGKTYDLDLNYHFVLSIAILILITVATGALSGFLVSYKITSLSLIESMKGKAIVIGNKHSLRKAMLVFQLSIFMILIAVMVLVQKQVHYAFTKDLGFSREGLIRVPLGDHNFQLFKQELSKNPGVLSVSGSMWMPPHSNHMTITMPKVDEHDKIVTVNGLFVDYNFATTMGIKILKGDDFNEAKINSGVLVNEMAVKELGLKDAIGETTEFGSVVGVIPDFNMYSLHEAVGPLIIGLNPSMCRDIAIRIKTDDINQTIASLKKTWTAIGGITPFEFEFTNDILKKMYESDILFSKTIGILAVIAIFIAGLGLFGLSLLTSRQKTKEIGVRKVMGAKITEVMVMLNKEFIVCVAIAFIVAVPVSWYAMNRWLETFAYKTGASWWIFIVSGILALAIAVLTVSYHAYRAATRNPVEALRYE